MGRMAAHRPDEKDFCTSKCIIPCLCILATNKDVGLYLMVSSEVEETAMLLSRCLNFASKIFASTDSV